jgi:hypothetical protein
LYSAGIERPETDNATAAAATEYAMTFMLCSSCSEEEEEKEE